MALASQRRTAEHEATVERSGQPARGTIKEA